MKKIILISLVMLLISITGCKNNPVIVEDEKESQIDIAQPSTRPIDVTEIFDVPDSIVINNGEAGYSAYRELKTINVTEEEFLKKYSIDLPEINTDKISYRFVSEGYYIEAKFSHYNEIGGLISYWNDTVESSVLVASIFVSETGYDKLSCIIDYPNEEPQKSYINRTEMVISSYSEDWIEGTYYESQFKQSGLYITLKMNYQENEENIIDALRDMTARTAPPPEETKPTNPTEETKPTDPTEPTDPTDPTLPPTEPTKPKDDAIVDDVDDADTTTE